MVRNIESVLSNCPVYFIFLDRFNPSVFIDQRGQWSFPFSKVVFGLDGWAPGEHSIVLLPCQLNKLLKVRWVLCLLRGLSATIKIGEVDWLESKVGLTWAKAKSWSCIDGLKLVHETVSMVLEVWGNISVKWCHLGGLSHEWGFF